MRILFFAWKDFKNPAAGGAEVMTWEVLKRLAALGHETVLFTSRYSATLPAREKIDGVEVYRAGGRYGVYLQAILYYLKYFKGRFDLVVDEVNTVPFFTPLFVREKKLVFFPQLAREIWFYETRFPISLLGYILEPVFLLFYRSVNAVTISPSSKTDLVRFGIKKIRVIKVVGNVRPLPKLEAKPPGLNLLFVGRLVPGKRPLEALRALVLIRREVREATLTMVGNGSPQYLTFLRDFIDRNGLSDCVFLRQGVNDEERDRLFRQASLLLVTSVKEGWGLVVTEANSQGTPAVVYNVDGLRDSVRDGQTGLVCCQNSPAALAQLCLHLYCEPKLYEKLRLNAWENSKEFTIEKTVNEFVNLLEAP